MRPKRYSTEGIVLIRRNFSEADRILSIYSKNYGKLSIIAKGVRKIISKKRGSLEIFSHIKFASARGKNLDIITEVEIINSFNTIRDSLDRVAVAYFFMEAVERTTREDEPNDQVYNLTLIYLKRLRTETKLKKLRMDFIFELLVILGFWPKDKNMKNPDLVLSEIVERELFSKRVGKQLVS